jgi:acetylornithine deacetylase/succinyl-diaminopimelate desuccinylase-like protein
MSGTDLRGRVTGLMGRARSDLAELVAIRSVADARQFPPDECTRAAEWVRDRFAELGFADLELAETADDSRAVVGSRAAADPGAPTVLLYAQYDVQPPLDEQAWRTPPFALTERDGRWYGRGAADCKGNVVMHLTALAALIAMLASLREKDGNTTVTGLDNTGTWTGAGYPADAFRADATALAGVSLLGDGSVADMLWARPAVTVLGIDCPPVVGSADAIQPRAAARLNLRVPPGVDADAAQDALVAHLRAAAPWGARVAVESEGTGAPFLAEQGGPAYAEMSVALAEAYGRPMTTLGEGGSIPLCTIFAQTYPGAEIILMGVEEPHALIHAPNESVDPDEIATMALAEALFLQGYAKER